MSAHMLDMAKDLIKKGEKLNDADLISMGMVMLEKYQEEKQPVVETFNDSSEYVCTNCGHTIPYDKQRKKCPKCKKNKLVLNVKESVIVQSSPHRVKAQDFEMQVRKPTNTRIRYNDEGQPEGMYAKPEPVQGISNVWQDDGSEGNDEENERLKKVTKVSPRTRKPAKMLQVVCEKCKTTHLVHPIHASGRARYLCDNCIKRSSRI